MHSKYSTALVIAAFYILTCTSRAAYAAAATTDPCTLLTQAQVSAALGVDVAPGQHVAKTACQWSAPGPSTPNAKKLTLTLQDPRAFAYAKMPVGHGVTKTPVSGIGDDAVSGTTPGLGTVLTVKKDSVVFVVHVFGFPTDEAEAKEKALAIQVLSKL
jgi:hypothetical protein